jgi:hypothetical protein
MADHLYQFLLCDIGRFQCFTILSCALILTDHNFSTVICDSVDVDELL